VGEVQLSSGGRFKKETLMSLYKTVNLDSVPSRLPAGSWLYNNKNTFARQRELFCINEEADNIEPLKTV
jgi:hypothetical protein